MTNLIELRIPIQRREFYRESGYSQYSPINKQYIKQALERDILPYVESYTLGHKYYLHICNEFKEADKYDRRTNTEAYLISVRVYHIELELQDKHMITDDIINTMKQQIHEYPDLERFVFANFQYSPQELFRIQETREEPNLWNDSPNADVKEGKIFL
jgi:hypothetical protein